MKSACNEVFSLFTFRASYSYISYSTTEFPQHNEAEHKSALTLSFQLEMCPQHGFCTKSHDSDAQSYYLSGSLSNVRLENHSRLEFRRCSLKPLGDLFQFYPLKLGDYGCSLFTLLCMNSFQHFATSYISDLGTTEKM